MNELKGSGFQVPGSGFQVPGSVYQYLIIGIIFLTIVPYPLFHGLDAMVLRQYDDARRGVNAYEMMHNGNLLVTHYDGKPDMWGTKPPFLIWMQAGLMLVLGPGELAVRLPSAIAGLLTCLLMVFFSARYLKNPWFGLIWAAVLITCDGYVDFHGTRTGDFDALLTLFMFLYALAFFLFTETGKRKYLMITAVFLILAVFTKGVAGLFFMPAILAWAIYKKTLREILTSRETWTGAGIFLFVIGGFYLSRELMNPGYLKAVSENELGGRYLETIEGHTNAYAYYFDQFIHPRLQNWIYFVIPGILAGFFIKNKTAKNLHLLGIFLVISHLAIITFSGTKLPWYDLPEYPFIALFITCFIWWIVSLLKKLEGFLILKVPNVLPLNFILLIFFMPLWLTYKEAEYIQERPYFLQDHEIAKFLREGVRGQRNLDGYVLVHEGYDAQCLFYLYLLRDEGQIINRKYKEQLVAGDKVIAHQDAVKAFIEGNNQADVLESRIYVRTYRITGE
jgi:4-amino-4-deoxy-L-arabinose transferase-like glycosyltransferase